METGETLAADSGSERANLDNEPRGTWTISYTDADADSSTGRTISRPVDTIAGVTERQARIDCEYYQRCCWTAQRRYTVERIV
jgi:hypothetical protein